MKLHRNLATAAVELLDAIFGGQVADRTIECAFETHPKWGARDRRWLAEAVYDCVRWRRLFAAAAGADDSWSLLGAWAVRADADVAGWPEWARLDPSTIKSRFPAPDWPRAIAESIPDWLDELGSQELPDRWDAEIAALNLSAAVTLRANTLKTSRDELLKRLLAQGIEAESIAELPDAIHLLSRKAVTRSAEYKEGLFEVQDGASQMVIPFLGVQPGGRAVDACAGAGGKTLHMAALMKNRGSVIALEPDSSKQEEMRRRCRRAGIGIVSTAACTDQNVNRLISSTDRLLLDVPCSSLGTLRRRPDLKWRLTPEFLSEIRQTQRHILSFYPAMLCPGGRMVYSTCSILPSENEAQIRWFLENNPEFKLLDEKRIWPSESEFDGFYMALLEKAA